MTWVPVGVWDVLPVPPDWTDVWPEDIVDCGLTGGLVDIDAWGLTPPACTGVVVELFILSGVWGGLEEGCSVLVLLPPPGRTISRTAPVITAAVSSILASLEAIKFLIVIAVLAVRFQRGPVQT